MTFQPASIANGILSLSRPLQNGLKHRADYAAVVRHIGSDLVGAVECASISVNILESDDDSWHREWFAAGETALKRAKQALKAANRKEAQNDCRRASIYFCAAELYLPYDDPRRSGTVERLEMAGRDYIKSLTPAGSIASIAVPGGGFHEAYLVENADPASPVVICIGGWNEQKESLIPLIEPALAWGLSILLVEPLKPDASAGRGYDRFGMPAFLMACIDYLEEHSRASVHPVAVYGVGAGASFASEIGQLDDRVCAIAGDFGSIACLQTSAIVRSFVGSDRSPALGEVPIHARQAATVINTSTEMTAVDVFDQIARRVLADRI